MDNLEPNSPREPNMPASVSHGMAPCYTPQFKTKESPAISRVKFTDLDYLVKKGEMQKRSSSNNLQK